jgi:restriction system protein
MTSAEISTFDALMNPVMQALKALGGSGTIEEINVKIAEIVGFSDEQLEVLHDSEKGGQTEFEYRLGWTRTYLKKYGVLENSLRGVWALTPKGAQLGQVDPRAVRREVQGQRKRAPAASEKPEVGEIGAETAWQDELMRTLSEMEPSAF